MMVECQRCGRKDKWSRMTLAPVAGDGCMPSDYRHIHQDISRCEPLEFCNPIPYVEVE